VVAEEETYDGIALPDLRVDSVTWTAGQAEHVRTRSSRYPGAVNLEPEWATEAVMDPGRRFGLSPASKTGEGIRVVGWSATAAQVLTVILIPEEHPPTGAWLGVTAWVTKGRDLRDYEAHETGDDADDQEDGTSP
jgi:hypothetical protein